MPKRALWLLVFAFGCGGGGGETLDFAIGDATPGAQDSGPLVNIDDAGAPLTSTAVTIIVEPSDNGDAFVNALKQATTSIHMTMYLLSDSDTIKALIAKKSIAKVVLNKTFPDSNSSNTSVFNQLKSAGVDVVWAPSSFTYTHEKCAIIDGTTAWIMTMNATFSAPTSNREYLAIDSEPKDVAEAEAIFAADFANEKSVAAAPLVVSPTNSRVSLVAFIGSAKQSIDLEVEELSDYKIVGALETAQMAGVVVHVTLSNETASSSQTSSVAQLQAAGVVVKQLTTPYVHAKAIVVDGTSAFVGSENFTTNSLQYNRELGVFFGTASEVQKVQTTIAADFTAGTTL